VQQRLSQSCAATQGLTSDGDEGLVDDNATLTPMLQLLNFEVALRRADPNAKLLLIRLAEEATTMAKHLYTAAELCLKLKQRDLARLAFDHALDLLTRSSPAATEFDKVAEVLRRLIQISVSRAQSKPHFSKLRELLKSFTSANVPMTQTDLYWFATESWNRGVNAYKEQKSTEAEEWMSGAFAFSNLSSSLAWLTEKMGKQYQIVMKACQKGDKSFSSTMSKRLLAPQVTSDEITAIASRSQAPLVI